MPAGESTHPVMRPYLAAAKKFASGADTPRQFLERSLELFALWEPRIGAFVLSTPVSLFYLTLVCSAVAAFVAWRLENSRLGRAWMALRDRKSVV